MLGPALCWAAGSGADGPRLLCPASGQPAILCGMGMPGVCDMATWGVLCCLLSLLAADQARLLPSVPCRRLPGGAGRLQPSSAWAESCLPRCGWEEPCRSVLCVHARAARHGRQQAGSATQCLQVTCLWSADRAVASNCAAKHAPRCVQVAAAVRSGGTCIIYGERGFGALLRLDRAMHAPEGLKPVCGRSINVGVAVLTCCLGRFQIAGAMSGLTATYKWVAQPAGFRASCEMCFARCGCPTVAAAAQHLPSYVVPTRSNQLPLAPLPPVLQHPRRAVPRRRGQGLLGALLPPLLLGLLLLVCCAVLLLCCAVLWCAAAGVLCSAAAAAAAALRHAVLLCWD